MNENEEILRLFQKLIKKQQERYEKDCKESSDFRNFLPRNEGMHEYFINHKDEIIFGMLCRELKGFLPIFKQHFEDAYQKNNLNFEEYYKSQMERPDRQVASSYGYDVYMPFYNYSEEDETHRLLMTQLFPTGKEKEIIEYVTNQDETAAIDKIMTTILDKVIGKGNYQYITLEETLKIEKELKNNPNLTLQQWVELNSKKTKCFFYQGGALSSGKPYLYEKYLNNPEWCEYEYKQWKSKVQENLKSDQGRSR